MIDFACPQCHAAFSVPDNLGGRRARCKKCQTPLTIPMAEAREVLIEPENPARASRRASTPQGRRRADAPRLRELSTDQGPGATGEPPDSYEVEYYVKGLERIAGRKEPIERSYHLARSSW
jgi:hypothetical protein